MLFTCLYGAIPCQALTKDKIPPQIGTLWPAEEEILKQVATGKTEDLAKVFGQGEKKRQLRAEFLVLLLTNKLPGVEVPSVGVKIIDAIIINRLDLEFAEIPFEVRIIDCKIEGEVYLKDSHFKHNLQIIGIIGKKSCLEKDANFLRMTVDKNAYFNNTTFKGEVNFSAAEIGKEFSITNCHFGKKKSIFTELEVGRNLYLNEAEFLGPVDFQRVKVGRDLNADAVKFLNKAKANFNNIIVSGGAPFPETKFYGGVSMEWARMKHLELINGVYAPDIDLRGTLIEDGLTISKAAMDNLQAPRLNVKLAELQNITINKTVDLRDSILSSLKMIDIKWPENQGKQDSILLDGLTYNYLTGGEPPDYKKITEPLYRSRFNSENYFRLETFLTGLGQQDWADQVYISRKDQELEQKAWWNPERWLIKIFWGWLAGYGRKPFRIFWPALVIVLIGMYFNDPQYLEAVEWPKQNKVYALLGRFMLSLEQFMPMVDLGLAKKWNPPETSWHRSAFIHGQRLLGLILIPILVTAIYIQFKGLKG
jgi:hypothetical protein